MDRKCTRWSVILCGVVLLACSTTTEPPPPDIRDPAALNILQLAQNAPPLWNSQARFYAIRGEDRDQSRHHRRAIHACARAIDRAP